AGDRRVVDARDGLGRLAGPRTDAAGTHGVGAARRAGVGAADAAPAAADPGIAAADGTVRIRAARLRGNGVAGVAEALRTGHAGARRIGRGDRPRLRAGRRVVEHDGEIADVAPRRRRAIERGGAERRADAV